MRQFSLLGCINVTCLVFFKSKPKYFIRYQERFDAGLEPHRFDKDIIRTWIREQCDPYSAMELPKVTDELIETTSKR